MRIPSNLAGFSTFFLSFPPLPTVTLSQSQFTLAIPTLVPTHTFNIPLLYSLKTTTEDHTNLSELDIFLNAHPEIQRITTETGLTGYQIPNVGLIVLEDNAEPTVVNENGMEGLHFENIDRLPSDFNIGHLITKTEINSHSQLGVWFPENFSDGNDMMVSVTNADAIFITDFTHFDESHHKTHLQIEANLKAEPNAKLYFTFYESGYVREITTFKPSTFHTRIKALHSLIAPRALSLFVVTLSDEESSYIKSVSYVIDEEKSHIDPNYSDFFNTIGSGFIHHTCEPPIQP